MVQRIFSCACVRNIVLVAKNNCWRRRVQVREESARRKQEKIKSVWPEQPSQNILSY